MQNEMMKRIAALSRRDQKIALLYEQGVPKKSVGAYLRRWLGWVGVGVVGLITITGCNTMLTMVEHNEIKNACQKDATYYIEYTKYTSSKWLYNKKINTKEPETTCVRRGKENEFIINITTGVISESLYTYWRCGEIKYGQKCMCYGAMSKGCKQYDRTKRTNVVKDIAIKCDENKDSCMIVLMENEILIYYRKNKEEYEKIVKLNNKKMNVEADERKHYQYTEAEKKVGQKREKRQKLEKKKEQKLEEKRKPMAGRENAEAGKKVYAANCAFCHGDAGKGDGAAGAVLTPKPTDFTDKSKLSKSDNELFESISDGIKGTAMPGYANQLSEEDRQVVIAYIRTFGISAYGQKGVGKPIAQPVKRAPSQTTTPSPAKDLIDAAEKGDTVSVNALLNKGADVNAKDKDGWTALIFSSKDGHTEIVKALLDKGADVNAKTNGGDTALMKASFHGHLEIVKALLDKGADVEIALMLASKHGDIEIVKMLLDKGADVNEKNENGLAALMVSSLFGHTEIVKTLLDKGADVNTKDKDGITALMSASLFGNTEIVKMLLDKGADVNAKTDRGDTALMKASLKGHTEIVKLLKKAGAKK